MVKKILKVQALGLLLMGTSLLANTHINCDDLIGCKKKSCHINQDITIAKKVGNEDRLKGLEISLEKVNKYCTNDKLIEDLEDKIKDTEKDLQEDTKDYEEALINERPDKIKKYKAKMTKEVQKIEKLKDELKVLKWNILKDITKPWREIVNPTGITISQVERYVKKLKVNNCI